MNDVVRSTVVQLPTSELEIVHCGKIRGPTDRQAGAIHATVAA